MKTDYSIREILEAINDLQNIKKQRLNKQQRSIEKNKKKEQCKKPK